MTSKLKVIKEVLLHPKEIITLGYQAMVRKRNHVDFKKNVLSKYNCSQLPTVNLLDLFPVFEDNINTYSFLPDTSLITDILMLKGFAKKFDRCAYLEIGSFRGESIAAVSEVAGDCLSITLSGDEMRQMGATDDDVRVHGIFTKGIKNIEYIYHNSLTFDFSKLGRKFDLIFIDGDHSYNGVVQDTRNMFKLLKDDRSIIVWHDYGYDSENVRHEVLEAILDGTPAEYHQHLYHISNTMCAVFMKGKFNTSFTGKHAYPNKVFRIDVGARQWTGDSLQEKEEKNRKVPALES
jgi:hypothetical protein